MFGIIILIRILFAACMVFIIGYVFGNFSKRPALATITKVASILAIVLFISANILSFHFAPWQHGAGNNCRHHQNDTTLNRY
jgi:EamA domain-containing membrane protein RarD